MTSVRLAAKFIALLALTQAVLVSASPFPQTISATIAPTVAVPGTTTTSSTTATPGGTSVSGNAVGTDGTSATTTTTTDPTSTNSGATIVTLPGSVSMSGVNSGMNDPTIDNNNDVGTSIADDIRNGDLPPTPTTTPGGSDPSSPDRLRPNRIFVTPTVSPTTTPTVVSPPIFTPLATPATSMMNRRR